MKSRRLLLVLASALPVAACATLVGFPDVPNPADAGSDDGSSGASSRSGSGASSGSGSGASSGSSSGSAFDSGGVGTGCDAGQIGCGGVCVPSDIHHCASCTSDCTKLPNVSATMTSCAGSGCSFAASACAAGFADCNGVATDGCETDITTNTDCGRCGHGCSGAQCLNGACQPQPLISGIDTPKGMDVDANKLYFAVDGVIQSCPLSGCAAGPTQLGSFTFTTMLVAVNGSLAIAGQVGAGTGIGIGLYLCPSTGCPTSNTAQQFGSAQSLVAQGSNVDFLSIVSSGSPTFYVTRCTNPTGVTCTTLSAQAYKLPQEVGAPIADDGTDLFFNLKNYDDGGTSIAKCPLGVSCVAPAAPSVVTSGFQATNMVAYGGQLYMTGSTARSGDLAACSAKGCSSPTSFNTLVYQPTQGLVADQDGVYFTSGNSFPATGNEVSTCPLAGCGGGGARPIARNQPSPSIIRTDSQFVYWVNQGQPGDGSSAFAPGTASIMRVAK